MEPIRLQKWIAQLGLASRREAEQWIKDGRLLVNGKAPELGAKINPETDRVSLDGKPVKNEKPPLVYWMMNKPDKFLVSRQGEDTKQCIFDLPSLAKVNFQVFPVGRLDYRTEGLLLLTNDGDLSHRLCHPSYKLPRSYHVLINGKLTKEQFSEFKKGLQLEDGPVRCEIVYGHGHNMGKSKGSWYFVTVFEGRNRLVRRMFEKFDYKVVKLFRYGFGDLRLPEDLKAGQYKQLNTKEINYLKKSVQLK